MNINLLPLFIDIFKTIIEDITGDIFAVKTSNVGALFKDIFDGIFDFDISII